MALGHIPRAYVDADLSPGQTLTLDSSTSHHLRTVLRLRPGNHLVLFNGQGGEYPCIVADAGKHHFNVTCETFNDINRESPLHTHLGLAVLKRDAMLSALQRAVELGVSAITPLMTEFVDVPTKQLDRQFEKWHRVLQMAAEQSGRTAMPVLNSPISLKDWRPECALNLLCSVTATQSIDELDVVPDSVSVLIGPEGGLSDRDLSEACEPMFPVKLGSRILRAETMPATALAVIQGRWGDFSSR